MPSNKASAHAEYPKPVERHATTVVLERAISLLASSGSYAEIVALFEARVPYTCIKEWRRGRVSVPQWALDLIADRMAPYAEIGEQARSVAPKRHAPNILAWNARRNKKEPHPNAAPKSQDE